eukprot:ANDGO_07813.mRNA.1 hypothetical protein
MSNGFFASILVIESVNATIILWFTLYGVIKYRESTVYRSRLIPLVVLGNTGVCVFGLFDAISHFVGDGSNLILNFLADVGCSAFFSAVLVRCMRMWAIMALNEAKGGSVRVSRSRRSMIRSSKLRLKSPQEAAADTILGSSPKSKSSSGSSSKDRDRKLKRLASTRWIVQNFIILLTLNVFVDASGFVDSPRFHTYDALFFAARYVIIVLILVFFALRLAKLDDYFRQTKELFLLAIVGVFVVLGELTSFVFREEIAASLFHVSAVFLAGASSAVMPLHAAYKDTKRREKNGGLKRSGSTLSKSGIGNVPNIDHQALLDAGGQAETEHREFSLEWILSAVLDTALIQYTATVNQNLGSATQPSSVMASASGGSGLLASTADLEDATAFRTISRKPSFTSNYPGEGYSATKATKDVPFLDGMARDAGCPYHIYVTFYFEKFLRREFSAENLYFFMDTWILLHVEPELKGDMLHVIEQTYFDANSVLELNLPGDVRETVIRKIHEMCDESEMERLSSERRSSRNGAAVVHAESQISRMSWLCQTDDHAAAILPAARHCYSMMRTDSFPRFVDSKEFLEMKQRYENEDRKVAYIIGRR